MSEKELKISLINACKKGDAILVAKLIQAGKIDPSVDNNKALEKAHKYGHVEVVKLLINDPRVDLSFALRLATLYGHDQIVRLILDSNLIHPSIYENIALKNAIFKGHSNVVKMLLDDPRTDPSANNNDVIIYASCYGKHDVMKMLLTHKCVNPADQNNLALKTTSFMSPDKNNITKLLLQSRRVYMENGDCTSSVLFCEPIFNTLKPIERTLYFVPEKFLYNLSFMM